MLTDRSAGWVAGYLTIGKTVYDRLRMVIDGSTHATVLCNTTMLTVINPLA